MRQPRVPILMAAAVLVSLTCLAQEPAAPAPAPVPTPTTPAPAAPPPAAKAPESPALSKAAVLVDGKAKSDGLIELWVGASPDTMQTVRVTVASGMKADAIARDVEKELKVALGAGYDVSQSGPKVSLKAPKKQTFRLSVGSVTPLGVAVKVK